ncbi:MAG: PQQ-binding-like beta-propeller repeat protein [Niabella sp.]|nr:PQQ-binding-like beta-propeller repeat protein [Niabella sp.]
MSRLSKKYIRLLPFVLLVFSSCKNETADYTKWENYAGTKDGMRYSALDQIDTTNVTGLQEVWRFSTHDKDTTGKSQIQCNPIIVNGTLYGVSPASKLFALDAAAGTPRWIFDPAGNDSRSGRNPGNFNITRGVTYWTDGSDSRIFYSAGKKIFAVAAGAGTLIKNFGHNGWIDLSEQLGRDAGPNPYITGTTPGIIYKDLLIVGSRVAETADAAPGDIRAYDVRTGALRWTFHTIPHPGEKGYETWPDTAAWRKLGGANCWAGMSVDEQRGVVYVPTGSVAGDFYGGIRKGTNLFANSIVALDAETGNYLWHYQTVHHDLWDRDLPANPNLVTVTVNGKKAAALAQITKQGYIFLLDRTNGKPIFEIREMPVSTKGLPGEEPWPTQPVPVLPEPFARQQFTAADIFSIDEAGKAELTERFRKIRYHQLFDPPSKEGSWIFPGFDGGGEWGGAAVDPASAVLYVFSSELPWSLTMVDVPRRNASAGQRLYNQHCASCHRPDLRGDGSSFPSLANIADRLAPAAIKAVIRQGRNRMPSFAGLPAEEITSLVAYITHQQEKEPVSDQLTGASGTILDQVPYMMTGYNRFLDKNGYPGIRPPWGTLNAVNLNTGKLLWKVPVGEYAELTRKGIPVTGTEGYGGPIVTKGGLVFIAASKDKKIRAFDKRSGKQLWVADLPAAGFATPASYMVRGVQYIVIACGGGKIGAASGDEYVAFALKK